MQRTLELEYDKLVIGSDLSALSICLKFNCPSFFVRILYPYEYNEQENWIEKQKQWQEKAYKLSFDNKFPFSDKIVSFRLEENDILKVITKLGLVVSVKYNKLFITDDYLLEGLPPVTKKTNNDNWVIDWYNFSAGCNHGLDSISDDDLFIKKVYFYTSKRGFMKTNKKDIVAVSKISDDNLNNFDYSETAGRFKIMQLLEKSGIKGIWDKTNNRFVKPKLVSAKRDIYPLGKNIYNNLPKNIEIIYE